MLKGVCKVNDISCENSIYVLKKLKQHELLSNENLPLIIIFLVFVADILMFIF